MTVRGRIAYFHVDNGILLGSCRIHNGAMLEVVPGKAFRDWQDIRGFTLRNDLAFKGAEEEGALFLPSHLNAVAARTEAGEFTAAILSHNACVGLTVAPYIAPSLRDKTIVIVKNLRGEEVHHYRQFGYTEFYTILKVTALLAQLKSLHNVR